MLAFHQMELALLFREEILVASEEVQLPHLLRRQIMAGVCLLLRHLL
jgi:hypothetical protein